MLIRKRIGILPFPSLALDYCNVIDAFGLFIGVLDMPKRRHDVLVLHINVLLYVYRLYSVMPNIKLIIVLKIYTRHYMLSGRSSFSCRFFTL